MTILHPDTEPEQGYQRLQQLFQQLASSANDQWDTLSMGMSGDYVQAIAAGATCIRVGTAIFRSENSQQSVTEQTVSEHTNIAFIGAGNMATSLISGLLADGYPAGAIMRQRSSSQPAGTSGVSRNRGF